MANLTISVDAAVLREARIEALHRNTSVNKLLAEYLSEIAGKRRRQKEAMDALFALMDENPIVVRSGTYTRDELHERR